MYLAIKNNNILWLVETIENVFEKLNIVITEEGEVLVNNVKDTVNYNIKHFSKEDIIKYIKTYRLKNLATLSNIVLFNVTKI